MEKLMIQIQHLVVEAHGKKDCVNADGGEDEVLKERASHKRPNLKILYIIY